jgi:hypothetical protein
MPKTRSTLVIDEDLWKRFRMIAIMNDMEISELVEQALREKLERMKQLEEYESYKDVKNLRVSKNETGEAGDDKKERERISKTANYARGAAQQSQLEIPPGINPPILDYFTDKLRIVLPSIDYPLNKAALIRHVKEFQTEFSKKYDQVPIRLKLALILLDNLPDSNKVYRDQYSLNFDLDVLVGDREKMKKVPGGHKGFKYRGSLIAQPKIDNKDEFMKRMIEDDSKVIRAYRERKQQQSNGKEVPAKT